MGSGKTSVGRQVARLLGWDFLDLDDEIAVTAGETIPRLFALEGEAGFRRRERDTLSAVLAGPQERGLVLALGGGTILNAEARPLLCDRALLVYLEIDAETAWERVSGSDRPLARDEETFRRLLEHRRPAYEAAADVTLNAGGKTVAEIARELADIARTAGGAQVQGEDQTAERARP